jgi:hypothetical protein
VSPDIAVTDTISSLIVSTSKAIRNWSTLPTASVTPPISGEPVAVVTVSVVALLDIVEASAVAILVVLYLRVID